MGVKNPEDFGLPSADPEKTLVSAIVEFREGLTEKGSLCQCCGRFGKVYCRKINRTMCKGLIWLINEERRTGGRYHAVPAELRQLPTLKHWGLVERLDNSDEKKRGGLWAATPFGERFACNAMRMPERVDEYNGRTIRLHGRQVLISEGVGIFNYEELMSPVEVS